MLQQSIFDPTERLHFYFKIILVFYNSSCNQVLLSSLNGSLHTVIHIRNKSENMSNKIDYRTKVKLYTPKYSKHWLSTVAHTIDCVCVH